MVVGCLRIVLKPCITYICSCQPTCYLFIFPCLWFALWGNDKNTALPFVSHCRHVGCDCADGWEGDHCETAIESLSMTQMLVSQATNTKNVGLIVGLVVGSVVGVILLLVAKEKYVDRPRRARTGRTRS